MWCGRMGHLTASNLHDSKFMLRLKIDTANIGRVGEALVIGVCPCFLWVLGVVVVVGGAVLRGHLPLPEVTGWGAKTGCWVARQV